MYSQVATPLHQLMTKVKIVLKLVTKSVKIRRLCNVFMDSHSTQEDVRNAGIDIFKALWF